MWVGGKFNVTKFKLRRTYCIFPAFYLFSSAVFLGEMERGKGSVGRESCQSLRKMHLTIHNLFLFLVLLLLSSPPPPLPAKTSPLKRFPKRRRILAPILHGAMAPAFFLHSPLPSSFTHHRFLYSPPFPFFPPFV